jgi:hypothetical protein
MILTYFCGFFISATLPITNGEQFFPIESKQTSLSFFVFSYTFGQMTNAPKKRRWMEGRRMLRSFFVFSSYLATNGLGSVLSCQGSDITKTLLVNLIFCPKNKLRQHLWSTNTSCVSQTIVFYYSIQLRN